MRTRRQGTCRSGLIWGLGASSQYNNSSFFVLKHVPKAQARGQSSRVEGMCRIVHCGRFGVPTISYKPTVHVDSCIRFERNKAVPKPTLYPKPDNHCTPDLHLARHCCTGSLHLGYPSPNPSQSVYLTVLPWVRNITCRHVPGPQAWTKWQPKVLLWAIALSARPSV